MHAHLRSQGAGGSHLSGLGQGTVPPGSAALTRFSSSLEGEPQRNREDHRTVSSGWQVGSQASSVPGSKPWFLG